MSVGANIYRFLRARGFTPQQAAGVVGNAQQESSLNPRAPGGGLFQGIGGRARLGRGNEYQQIKTALSEEPGAWKALRGARTAEQAARIFSEKFERPGIPMLGNRERYAREALSRYSGLSPSSPQEGGQSPSEAPQTAPGGPDTAAIAALLAKQQPEQAAPVTLKLPNERPGAIRVPAPAAPEQPDQSAQLAALLAKSEGGAEGTALTQANAPKQTKAEGTGPLPKGTAEFGGKQVAAWIAPILQYARAHGWKGSVNSGYRSFAEQTRIYNSGVRPAARPGTSNHEGADFPRGAVDVSEAEQLARILERSPYRGKLVWAGSKDPVHFSHPHNGSY